ncbi:sodium/potassium/calcium exchanger Nckx30C isoform X4 [Lepeophtheirus salmonis]|uniref:sodium/potassium/calcium exchanger Nckx30C isoform X4 n=1 Tax=Lepeophtheirus salmonis TaxID=72036 RepID=UPI001AE92B02|nr:sodium/potassium/calcium exchanger Nckx30C-like isoform X3 [Lepeophtheirus salmonis]
MKKSQSVLLRTGFFVLAVGFVYLTQQSFTQESDLGLRSRKLLQIEGNEELDTFENETDTLPKDVVPPIPAETDDDGLLPDDLFTAEQLKNGAVVLHMIGVIYMFYALALVCDEYFVPSLDIISEKLGISPDVAGATFMAAGGSAPELFTSIIGVLIAKNDVGIGTIIGSAVFNILFVIAACAFAAKEALSLSAWPLIRDVFFYSLSLTLLVVFFLDNSIAWWESLILFVVYILYVSFMAINEKVEDGLRSLFRLSKVDRDANEKGIVLRKAQNRKGLYHLMNETINRDILGIMIMSNQAGSETGISLSGTGSTGNMDGVGGGGIAQLKNELQNSKGNISTPPYPELADLEKSGNNRNKLVPRVYFFDGHNKPNDVPSESQGLTREASTANEEEEEEKPIDMSFPIDQGWKKILVYIVSFPIMGPLYLTLPDTKDPKKKKFFFVTFVLSIVWIALYSYLMVWWATVAGNVFLIPPPVMGLTFLAAGTSVPDLITSVLVAKQGKGDMAVSSSVGSNIFDVTVGLPLPWLLYSMIYLSPVTVNSYGVGCSVAMLFLMLIFVFLSIIAFHWKMTKGMGIVMLFLYVFFVIISLLLIYGTITCPI